MRNEKGKRGKKLALTERKGNLMGSDRPVRHVPVLLEEVLRWLAPAAGQIWVDATVGAGGHALPLAEAVGPEGRLIALDQDPTMLALARSRLAGRPVTFIQSRFDRLPHILSTLGIEQVDGLLADLGFASDQVDDPQRGLSFRQDGPLDMRMDPTADLTAEEIVNSWSERDLARLLWEYGEERYSRRIARQIVEQRRRHPLRRTTELAELVRRCVPRRGSIDPATRTFQALRIAVNEELQALERLLAVLPDLIRPGGRVGFICFHSLEDRPVKQAFRQAELWQVLTRKPITPSEEEMARNPRARSARLRVAQRVARSASTP
jgi:16S rRNA (cytosine1402-N4)-methyltransferase